MKTFSRDSVQYMEPAQGCVCFALRKSARAMTQLYEEALRPTGLRATQFSLLVATKVMGTAPISRLAKELVMDRTTLTRNLKPLENLGLLKIVPGKDDARERQVTLTSTGQATLAKAFPLWKTVQQQVTKNLGRSRVDRLLGDLSTTIEIAQAS